MTRPEKSAGGLCIAPSEVSEGGGAPGSEIEITPAMIDAGLIPFLRFHRESSDDEDVVRQIYLAMRRVACMP